MGNGERYTADGRRGFLLKNNEELLCLNGTEGWLYGKMLIMVSHFSHTNNTSHLVISPIIFRSSLLTVTLVPSKY
jgi:hypothetical protein